MSEVNLRAAKSVELTLLADNYVGGASGGGAVVTRSRKNLLAQHGLSCLVRVSDGSEECTVLVDGGTVPAALRHNLDELELDLSGLDAVVLTHGHYDHYGGLEEAYSRLPEGVPLVVHPAAFSNRRSYRRETDDYSDPKQLAESGLERVGADIRKVRKPFVVGGDLLTTTGEVERSTAFETPYPGFQLERDGEWVTDELLDDQAVVIRVEGKGLVILGGCSHAGIINTVRHAMAVTGVDTVHAVLGGFHLVGKFFEERIEPTVREMVQLDPTYIVPMHCTGWKAIREFSLELPDQFLMNTVGSTYRFDADN